MGPKSSLKLRRAAAQVVWRIRSEARRRQSTSVAVIGSTSGTKLMGDTDDLAAVENVSLEEASSHQVVRPDTAQPPPETRLTHVLTNPAVLPPPVRAAGKRSPLPVRAAGKRSPLPVRAAGKRSLLPVRAAGKRSLATSHPAKFSKPILQLIESGGARKSAFHPIIS